jgi:outer membrane receptor for ferrienterochelin and colicin
MAIAALPAHSQDQDEETTETVVVTGSRIAHRADFEGPSPVLTVDRKSIEESGYNNVQQLLEKIPANGNGAFSTRGNNQDSTANGAASISLRGLGADATLVLVNGRRVAISSFAESVTTNFVDINSIPVAAIERIEVLKDGASAVYGSDAVAGVVNFVLRKDYQGFETSAGFGDVTSGSSSETSASAIWGTSGEDSNITMIFDYFKNTTLSNSERGHLGTADQTAYGGEDFRSSRGFPGRFIVTSASGTATRIDPGCPADRVAGQTCVYDYGPWNLLIPASERTGLMILGHKGFGAVEFFTEIGVQHNSSIAQGAPTPLDETAGLTVPITHPNNPYADATAITIGRFRTVDAGARQWDITTDNLRAVAGLRGKIGGWDWEVSGSKARSKSEQSGDRTMGWVRTDFLQAEINAGRYNPFGGFVNPPDEIANITTSLVRRGVSHLTTYDATISGGIFNMPAGEAQMAAGIEYREESVSDIPDDQFQRGLIFGTEAVSAQASRSNKSAFVEFDLPLLNGLDLQVAGRYDDYNDFGSTTNPKVAMRWSPIDSLAIRASWGKGFRAPSLAQIGLGPSQSSQFFTDTYGCAQNPVYCTNTDYLLVFSGNPNLQPETSETFNAGLVWRPGSFSATVDYWDIDQKKKIDAVPFGFLYTQFCNDQNSTICIRGTPLSGDTLGPLQQINTGFINIGKQTATGVDLGLYWNSDLLGGKLNLGLNYSYLLSFDRVELNSAGTAFVKRSLTGEYEYPENRFQLNADWDSGVWGVHSSINYVGSFEDTPDIDFDGTLDYDTNKSRTVAAFTTMNLQLRYTGFKALKLALSIDNLFDKAPPFAIGNGDDDVYGYVSSQHNPRGRFWSAKATYKF